LRYDNVAISVYHFVKHGKDAENKQAVQLLQATERLNLFEQNFF
jgi:hypothetical protein